MTKSLVLGLALISGLAAQVTITTTSPLPQGVANTPYSLTLSASGGTTPYTWTIFGSPQPPGGIALAASGLISGTANTATVSTFTVQVTDSSSTPLTNTMAFSLTIAPQITTTTLPASTINVAYPNTSVIAAGLSNSSPTWSASGLPSGMSITTDGILGGTPTASGNFTPAFSVTDATGAVGTANIPLTINPPPVINDASPLPSGDVAVAYSFQFGSTPVTGGTAPYTWSTASQLPPGLSLNSAGLLAGTPTSTGLYTFSIQVNDASTATGSKTFAMLVGTLPVLVSQIAAPPVSTVGVPYPPPLGAAPPYFQASRGTGTGYTWTSSNLPGGLAVNPAAGAQVGLSGTPTASGTFAASVTATDSAAETGNLPFNITINPAPAITTGSLQACTAGTSCTRTFSASGGTAPLSWTLSSGALPTGLTFSSAGVISGTPSGAGSPASFNITVTDSATANATQPFTLVVNPVIVISPASLPATSSGIAYSQTLSTTGGTGSITFTSTGLPSWLTLTTGGLLSGTAPSVATPTTYSFSVKATDSDTASATNSYSVVVNPLPAITTASALPSWTINRPYTQTIVATGGTGTLTFSDSGTTLPSWLTITGPGVLSGTPTATGPVTFTLQVTDGASAFSTKTFSLTINPTPSVTTTSLPAVTSAIAYNQTLAESGGTTPFTWQSTGLPAWLSLSTAGTLTGTAPAEASPTPFNFSVTVTDTAGAVSASQSLTVTVNPAVQITTTSPLQATGSGASYSQPLAASGGTGTITWSSSNLPSWLSLSSAGTLTGTAPTVATPTTYNFNVTATDSVGATGTKAFSVTVNPGLTIVTNSPLPSWTLNRPYTQTIAATGGTGTLTFSDNGTTLPSWLTITAGGILSGTPTATGPFSFTLRVTDSLSAFATKTFALTINPTPSVTTTTLPAVTSGIAYNQTLTESSGTTPFAWQAAGLPSWLNLSAAGVLAGTAPAESSPTPFNFSVTVSDAAGAVSNPQSLSVTVNPAVQITTTSPLPATGSGASYSQPLAASGGTGTITWSSTNLPSWLSLSSAGTLTGTAPTVATPTTYNFNVTATDSVGSTASKAFSVVVNPGLTITTSSPLPAWTINRPYTQTIAAVGGTGTLTFTDNGSTLPTWLTITSGGVLSGTPTASGPVSFTLRVTDSLSAFATKTFALTINPTPSVTTTSLPATTSGIAYNQTLAESGGTTPFTWQATGLPTWLTLSTSGTLTGTAPTETSATPFSFSVTVTDTAGAVSASQSLSVTVNPAVQVTTTSPLPATGSGASYSQTLAASGGTGAITWSSANLPSWLSLSPAGTLTGTAPTVSTPTTYNFNVTATDSVSATASKAFSVIVNSGLTITTNSPLPSWTINRPYTQTIAAVGGTGTLTFTDNGSTMPTWLTISSAGVLSGTPTATGPVSFTLRVTDSLSAFATKTFALTINPSPSVTTTTLPATTSGIAYNQTLAETGGTTPFTWQATGLPTWLTLSTAGALTGTAPAEASATPFNFSVTVTDAAGAASASQSLTVAVNPAVQITTTSPLPATGSGLSYSQTLAASGGTGTIAWSSANLPSWLSLSPAGTLTGTAPSVATPTTYNFNVTATDSVGATASKAFSVTVSSGLTITTSSPLPSWTINRPYTQTIAAVGGTGTLTFSDNGSTLPTWLTISSTGVLSGTPPATGPVSFTLRVTDSVSASATKTFALTINPPPSVTTTSLLATTSGTVYNQTLAETGGTTPITWQASNLPTWLSLAASGALSGTAPAVTSATPFNFSITATDAAGAVSASQNLSVTVNPAVQITTTSPLPSTGSGLSYSQTLAASGGTGTVTWSSANLPSWLSLSSAGVLSGTAPSVSAATPYNFNVTATDSVGAAASKAFSVTVTNQLTIVTASPLPSWTVNRPYSQTITAVNGTGTLAFSDNGQTLPSWLTISSAGALSGTPTATGAVSFTLRVTDSLAAVATKAFTLTINPPPSVTTTSLPSAVAGAAYSQTLAESGGTTPFTWQGTGLPSWLSLSPSGILSGTAPAESAPTPFTFSVTVTDTAGAVSAPQSLTVTVNPSVQITTASPLPGTDSGVGYSQNFASSGGTGTVTWTSTNLPAWLILSTSGILTGTAPSVTAATPYNFNITATDSLGVTGNKAFSVTVNPLVTFTATSPLPAATVNRPYSQTIATAGGTSPLTFADNGATLPQWLTITSAGVLSGTPPATGSATFTLRVTDSVAAFATKTFTLIINAPPSVTTTSLPAAQSGTSYSQTLAESGGTSPFTWQATGLPAWLSLSNAGTLSGTAPAQSVATPFNFSVTVTDAEGAVSAPQNLSVTVNPAVQITTASPLPATESGLSFSQTLASSGGTGTVTWTSTNLPSWLSLSPAGALSGTAPAVSAATPYNFNVTATDSLGITGSKAFTVTVNPAVTIVTTSPLPAWTVNQPYTQTITATGGVPTYTFADLGTTLPSWLAISAGGSLTGTPPATGTFSFTVKVNDKVGGVATKTFALKIDPALSVTTTSLPATTSSLTYSQTLAASGGTGTVSFAAAGLPAWLAIAGTTLSGTAPAVSAPTPFTFSVTASDGTGAISPAQPLSVTVNPSPAITTSSPLATAASGALYSQTFAATGGTGAITWTFGNRPSWLTQTGATLSGTAPTVTQPTPFTFTATATDSLGASSGSQQFSVTVSNGVIITTAATLGPWTVTRPFTATLAAVGGTAPYTFTDASQTLPQWLTLTGAVLSGTPPTAGPFQFTIKAADSVGASTTKAFTLVINAVPSVTTTLLPSTTSGVPYSQALATTGGTPPLTWNGVNLPTWLSLNGPSLTGTAPAVTTVTPYGFSVTVTDSAGASSTAPSLALIVNPAVTITTTSPLPIANPGVTYSVSFTATGGTGTLAWTASNLPSWLTLNGNALTGVPPASAAGTTVGFTVRATDTVGAFASSSFQITVANGSQSNNGTLPPWTVNRPYSTTLNVTSGTPPYRNWSLTGALPLGLQLNSSTGTISGTPTTPGTANFTVAVTDSANLVFPTAWTLTINPAPSIPAQTLPPATPGTTYSYLLTVNGGTRPFACSATGLNGSGLTMNSSCVLSGQPTATPPATLNFSASVTDAAGATAQGALSLLVAAPLSISTSALPATTSTAHYSATLITTGGTGAIVFSTVSAALPSWLSLSSQGALTGIAPAVGTATDFDFAVTAADSVGVAASKNFTVTVNPQPRITTASLPAGSASVPYSTQLLASGGTGTRVWSAQNLPAWAKLNTSTGLISGTPPAAATVTISAVVTDSVGVASKAASLVLEIDPPGGLPRITTACPFSPTTAGLSFSATAIATAGYPPYNWSATGLPSWLALDPTGAFSGTAIAGATAFTLQLTDSHGQSATLGCGLTVNPTPAIEVTSLAPGTVGAPYAQSLTAFGGTGTLLWSSITLSSWLTVEPLTGLLSGTPSVAGTYTFSLQVTDTLGAVSAAVPFTISVTGTGGIPTVTACPLPAGSVGTPMTFQLTAALGFPPYSWSATGLPAGLTATASGLVTGTPSAAGLSTVGLSAIDSANLTANASCPMNVYGTPAVTTTSLPNGTVGAFYWQTLAATGGVGGLRWSISGAPDWLNVDPLTGILSGTPATSGPVAFTVQVTDSHGTQSQAASFTINVTAPGGGFGITTVCPLPAITQGVLLDQVFTATGGAPPYSWSATGLPSGVLLNASGALLGTPAAGTLAFSVQATDQQQQQTAPTSCSVLINPAPAISTDTVPNAVAGTPYLAILNASGGTGARSWTAAQPYWLSIDPLTGDLSGTPPVAGPVSTTVQVSDRYGIAASKTFAFTVAAPATGSLPSLVSACPLPGATVGVSYSETLLAAGGSSPYQFVVFGLPAGLTLSSGVISGTAQTSGNAQLVVEVIDAAGINSAPTTCGLAVAPSGLSIVVTAPSGRVNQTYSGGFTAAGGVSPYAWTIGSGALPAGIVLNKATGALSGTPTKAGTYPFAVTVTDSTQATASTDASINIAPALVITTPATLPDGTGGSTYQQTLSSSGATGTVTWSIASGALPTGLTLNSATGVISGSPTQAGTFTVIVQAADASGQTAQLQVTLTVDLSPIPSFTITGMTAAVTPGQQLTPTVTIAASYPLDITGQLNLTVTADPSIGLTDPAVQFAAGGTSIPFRIPANSTQAVFSPSPAFQTGTLAGTLALSVATLQTGGVSVQPPTSPAATGQIAKLAPVIVGTPIVTRTSSGLQVTLTAFATSRDVTSAAFQFTGTNLQTSSVTVPLSSLVGAWYSSAASNAYGSLFQIVQPFAVTGSPSQVTGVTITLTNSVGNSTAVTVSF